MILLSSSNNRSNNYFIPKTMISTKIINGSSKTTILCKVDLVPTNRQDLDLRSISTEYSKCISKKSVKSSRPPINVKIKAV